MMLRRVLFVLVASLVLWYLGHFGLNALLLAFAPELPGQYSRVIDLVLVPVSVAVAWWVMTRLTPGPPSRPARDGRPPESGGHGQPS